MGKMLNMQEIVSKNISMHNERALTEYNKFLSDKFVNTTFLRQNKIESTEDLGLRNVQSLIGDDSPVRYDKIDNVPVYGISELMVQLQSGEFGLETTINGTGTVVPDTIKPLPNDFFYFTDRLGKSYLFCITSLTNDRLDHGQFYQFNFELRFLGEEAEAIINQVVNEYVLVFDNVGGKRNASIIEKTSYYTLEYINMLKEKILDDYLLFFYDKKYNSISASHNNSLYIDSQLCEFIIRNKIFKRDRVFMNIIFLANRLSAKTDKVKMLSYGQTIFSALEKNNINLAVNINLLKVPFIKKSTPYEFTKLNPYDISHVNVDNGITFPFTETLIKLRNKDTDIEEGENIESESILYNILDLYFNKINTSEFTNADIENILDALNDTQFYPEFENYWNMPIILFILNKLVLLISQQINN